MYIYNIYNNDISPIKYKSINSKYCNCNGIHVRAISAKSSLKIHLHTFSSNTLRAIETCTLSLMESHWGGLNQLITPTDL